MIDDLDDDDWAEAFAYAGEGADAVMGHEHEPMVCAGSGCAGHGFGREDVAELKHATEGENDGPPWIACGRLHDGRWFYLEASCDYTGWDCIAEGQAWVADSWEALLRFGLTAYARDTWGY